MPLVKKKTRGFEVTSRVTKRAVARILLAVQNKLHQLISQKTMDEFDPEDVREALDHPLAKRVVQKHIKGQGLKLVEPNSNATIYKQQMSLIGDKGDRAANESPDARLQQQMEESLDPEEAELVSDNSRFLTEFPCEGG